MSRAPSSLIVAALAVAAWAWPAAAQTPDADVRLEGGGHHRILCNAIQLKSFNTAVWGDLTKWSGTPVTAESTKGKPVLIVTWSSYAKSTNSPAMQLAERLYKKYADKGLVVVAVHNPKGFDFAKDIAQQLGITFPYAADEQGKFRNTLLVDNDPDFYVVDRSGNLRFADVETGSVERAVELVVNETAEQAAAVPGRLAEAIAAEERAKMKIRDVKGVVKPGEPLTVPYTAPADDAYAKANWPAVITKSGFSQYDTFAERILKDKPAITLSDDGWASAKPVMTGRVTLIYLFDPLDTQIAEVAGKMSRLQSAYARDLVVVADLMQARDDGNQSEEQKQKDRDRRVASAKDYVRQTGLNHGLNVVAFQIDNQDLTQIEYPIDSRHHDTLAFMVSTDGKCRWVGSPYWNGFETVVADFLNADPGVQSRRRAEDQQAKMSGN